MNEKRSGRRKFFAGVDLGGTSIKFGAVDEMGVPVTERLVQVRRADKSPTGALDLIAAGLTPFLDSCGISKDEVAACGIASPGPATVDGVITRVGNLGHPDWELFPLRERLEESLGIMTWYGNDGTLAALAEAMQYPGEAVGNLALGSGIGGGYADDAGPRMGPHGADAEWGHILIPLEAAGQPPVGGAEFHCSCKRSSCFEAYASILGLEAMVDTALKLPAWYSHPLGRTKDRRERACKVLDFAQQGDTFCIDMLLWQASVVGVGISQIVHTVDLDVMVLSGGVAEVGDRLWTSYLWHVTEAFRENALAVFRNTRIERAHYRDRAGAIGAALYARHHSA